MREIINALRELDREITAVMEKQRDTQLSCASSCVASPLYSSTSGALFSYPLVKLVELESDAILPTLEELQKKINGQKTKFLAIESTDPAKVAEYIEIISTLNGKMTRAFEMERAPSGLYTGLPFS